MQGDGIGVVSFFRIAALPEKAEKVVYLQVLNGIIIAVFTMKTGWFSLKLCNNNHS